MIREPIQALKLIDLRSLTMVCLAAVVALVDFVLESHRSDIM